jgi:signal transduction histidine kinase
VAPGSAELLDNERLDIVNAALERSGGTVETPAQPFSEAVEPRDASCECAEHTTAPVELTSHDPEELRAALTRVAAERRRAECHANIQTEVVSLSLDLLVREPDTRSFFGALTKTVVEESESHTCAVWLLDEAMQRCDLWMAYVKDRLFTSPVGTAADEACEGGPVFPRESMARHLFDYKPGWIETVEYPGDDPRLPEPIRAFSRAVEWDTALSTPLVLGGRTLGWMTVCSLGPSEAESRWWRVVLVEAIAQQATLALHYSRLVDANRREERRKAILEERNRLARDIHDNLAQGFAAILMQLQAAQRQMGNLPPAVAASVETAVELARTHLTEARRSVGALRPNVGSGEDIPTALKRLADMGQRTSSVPIDLLVDELPRFGDGVEREIVAIAQEALTNAVRHSRARRITISASVVPSVGFRLSVADDGRGIGRDTSSAGYGMTSMQERAERIGASLTIVTAPRNGTEVVLAWQPSSLPTQVHVVG